MVSQLTTAFTRFKLSGKHTSIHSLLLAEAVATRTEADLRISPRPNRIQDRILKITQAQNLPQEPQISRHSQTELHQKMKTSQGSSRSSRASSAAPPPS